MNHYRYDSKNTIFRNKTKNCTWCVKISMERQKLKVSVELFTFEKIVLQSEHIQNLWTGTLRNAWKRCYLSLLQSNSLNFDYVVQFFKQILEIYVSSIQLFRLKNYSCLQFIHMVLFGQFLVFFALNPEYRPHMYNFSICYTLKHSESEKFCCRYR